jgi:hypothetical protein
MSSRDNHETPEAKAAADRAALVNSLRTRQPLVYGKDWTFGPCGEIEET